jgi:hypothetical protein
MMALFDKGLIQEMHDNSIRKLSLEELISFYAGDNETL